MQRKIEELVRAKKISRNLEMQRMHDRRRKLQMQQNWETERAKETKARYVTKAKGARERWKESLKKILRGDEARKQCKLEAFERQIGRLRDATKAKVAPITMETMKDWDKANDRGTWLKLKVLEKVREGTRKLAMRRKFERTKKT